MKFFIRTKNQEAFVEAENLKQGFIEFVKQTPLEQLGAILLGYTEYFLLDPMPEGVIGIRVTIPLVEAGIWTAEMAKDFNETLIGKRIV